VDTLRRTPRIDGMIPVNTKSKNEVGGLIAWQDSSRYFAIQNNALLVYSKLGGPPSSQLMRICYSDRYVTGLIRPPYARTRLFDLHNITSPC
jgi:hypothetical protein